jgi:D-galactarolactone isomerase
VASVRASHSQLVPFSAGIELPNLKAPPDACDCHMHILSDRFPTRPEAAARPDAEVRTLNASVEAYRALQKRIGTTRNIVVTATNYGTDNRIIEEALAEIGPTARAVAVVDTSVSEAELRRLSSLGVRGIRFNFNIAGPTSVDMIEPLSRRVNDLGWHIQISTNANQIVALEGLLKRIPSPVVFDHFGHPLPPASVNDAVFGTVRRLIDTGRIWVKMSGAYMVSAVGPPSYADVTALAQAYVSAAPERMLWGSDWPHRTLGRNYPNDAILFDLLAQWVPDEATRTQILVRNPAALYGFGKSG